ncbi:MAG: magnesium/cobalt transporter CorA [Thermomicrobiales bacterium]
MIVATQFQTGAAAGVEVDIQSCSEILEDPASLLWVSVVGHDSDDLKIIEEEFAIHYLAIEAAGRTSARPEIDFYDNFIYINFYAFDRDDGLETELHMISFFVGPNFLVTVQDRPIRSLGEINTNWIQSTRESGQHGVGLLLYSVLDPIVDDYFLIVDAYANEIDAIETEIFEGNSPESLQRLFDIKKRAMEFRRVLAPERDLLNTLLRWDSPLLDRQTIIYLQDVYDHLLRVVDSIDNYRDLLGTVLDAHLSLTSNRLNQTMKTLTASSIILMGMTLVASIYGMNFERMPELSWNLGYWFALGLMTLIGTGLVVVFRRIDWI